MDDLLALAADSCIADSIGAVAKRKHVRTHGRGPGKSAEYMRLVAKKRKMDRLEQDNDALRSDASAVSAGPSGIFGATSTSCTFGTIASSRCSFNAIAHLSSQDRRAMARHMFKHLAVLHRAQRLQLMHLLSVGFSVTFWLRPMSEKHAKGSRLGAHKIPPR